MSNTSGNKSIIRCIYCKKPFVNKQRLSIHIKDSHQTLKPSDKKKDCHYCGNKKVKGLIKGKPACVECLTPW